MPQKAELELRLVEIDINPLTQDNNQINNMQIKDSN
jgi:hypothetical protein